MNDRTYAEATLKSFTDDKLLAILECEKFKDLEIHRSFTNAEFVALKEFAKQRIQHIKIISNIFSRSISVMMLEVLCMIDISQLTAMPSTIFTLTLTGLFGVALAIVNIGTIKGLQHKQEKTRNNLQLKSLQIACANEYLKRHGKTTIEEPLIEEKKDQKIWSKIRDACITGCVVSATLFATYFVASDALLTAFGAASFAAQLTCPLGMVVAVAVSLMIGLYLSYKQYVSSKNEYEVKRVQKHFDKEFKEKYKECREIKAQTHTKKVGYYLNYDTSSNKENTKHLQVIVPQARIPHLNKMR